MTDRPTPDAAAGPPPEPEAPARHEPAIPPAPFDEAAPEPPAPSPDAVPPSEPPLPAGVQAPAAEPSTGPVPEPVAEPSDAEPEPVAEPSSEPAPVAEPSPNETVEAEPHTTVEAVAEPVAPAQIAPEPGRAPHVEAVTAEPLQREPVPAEPAQAGPADAPQGETPHFTAPAAEPGASPESAPSPGPDPAPVALETGTAETLALPPTTKEVEPPPSEPSAPPPPTGVPVPFSAPPTERNGGRLALRLVLGIGGGAVLVFGVVFALIAATMLLANSLTDKIEVTAEEFMGELAAGDWRDAYGMLCQEMGDRPLADYVPEWEAWDAANAEVGSVNPDLTEVEVRLGDGSKIALRVNVDQSTESMATSVCGWRSIS